MFANETTSPRCLIGVSTNFVISDLPQDWDMCINDWTVWLTMSGLSPSTIRLRRDHVRSIARRSKTRHPNALTLGILITTCAGRRQSNEHRRALRTSFIGFCDWAVANGHMAENVGRLMPPVKESPPC